MRMWASLATAALFFTLASPVLAACPSADAVSHGLQLESGYSNDSLTQSKGSWNESYLQASQRNGKSSSFYASMANDSRFGVTDPNYEAGAYVAVGPSVLANASGSWSTTHQFLPVSSESVGVDARAGAGYGVQLQFGQRNYPMEVIDLRSVGLDRYAGDSHFAIKLTDAKLSTNPGDDALSETVSYSRMTGCDVESVSVSGGRDVELTGVGNNLAVYHALSYDVNEVHWFSSNFALNAGAGWYVLNGAYNRLEVRLAIRERI
jgi:YaiO family outer membrane protein